MSWVTVDPDRLDEAVAGGRDLAVAMEPLLDALRAAVDAAVDAVGVDPADPYVVGALTALVADLSILDGHLAEVASAARAADGGWSSPWLDPDSDSWVVNTVRAGTGQVVSPQYVGRLLDEGPDAASTVMGAAAELTPAGQHRRMAEDPARSVSDWWRATQSAGGAALDTVAAGIGVVAGANPAVDEAIGQVTGRAAGGGGRSRAHRDRPNGG